PTWFGLDRRLTMSLLTVNLLGGVDKWLHGAANLRGWGYAAAPDPVLLYVRGFDPATEQFRYAVNGRFGATASASGGITVPFQIALQGRLGSGRGRSAAARAASGSPLPVRPPPPCRATPSPRSSGSGTRSGAPPTRRPSCGRSPTRSTRGTACSRSRWMPACSSPRRGTTRGGRSSAPARRSP